MGKELTTKQKVAKIVELFKQIKDLGFRSPNLMIHAVPVLQLGEEWKVEREFSKEGCIYFTANLVDTKEEVSDITLFSGDLEEEK